MCVSLSAGLSVMLPTDQRFWKHCSSLARREEDEACVCVGEREEGLVFDQWEWEEFPRLCVCVCVCHCVRSYEGCSTLKLLRDDSSVLACSARAPVGINTWWGVEEVLWLCPRAGGLGGWRYPLMAQGHPTTPSAYTRYIYDNVGLSYRRHIQRLWNSNQGIWRNF